MEALISRFIRNQCTGLGVFKDKPDLIRQQQIVYRNKHSIYGRDRQTRADLSGIVVKIENNPMPRVDREIDQMPG